MLTEYSDCIEYRGGLKNFIKSLKKEDRLNVLFFGGSVTAGYGASDPEKTSWRAKTGEWLKNRFPDKEILFHSRALGESGTYMGCFRIDRILNEIAPHLVFLEYSINDYYDSAEKERAMLQFETIVRTIKTRYPMTDIVTLLVTDERLAKDASLGILHPQAEAHDIISNHYSIPSLKLGVALAKRINLEAWSNYFLDIVHPLDSAHQEYFRCIKEFLSEALKSNEIFKPIPSPSQYCEKLFDNKTIIDISKDFFTTLTQDGFELLNENKFEFKGKMIAKKSGAFFEMSFFGSEISVYTNKVSEQAPAFWLDGEAHVPAVRGALSHNPLKIASGLEEGLHTLRLETTAENTEIYAIFIG